ncbi:hypothetical protein [Dishui Lake phycodnavirus 3]|nr:hypothetical protein [Dishui Lake phycodnavirus 3]
MQIDTGLALSALGIGVFQMYQTFNKIRTTGDLSGHKRNFVILSIIASIFWFIYQYRRSGINLTLTYTTLGLALEVYILRQIMVKGKNNP